ncbi:MAG TPA: hypothetical protein VF882_02285 [Gemmatimonadales bacterium]
MIRRRGRALASAFVAVLRLGHALADESPAEPPTRPAAQDAPAPAAPPAPVEPGPSPTPATPAANDTEAKRAAAADRALERTLVQKGGLLLRPGRVEIVPQVSYAHSDGDAPPAASRDGAAFGARTDLFSGRLTLRLGLPLAFQVEASAPFVYMRITPGSDDALARAAEGGGLGDARLGLTWHALRGRSKIPDVLLGGFWKSRSGRTPLDDPDVRVPLGTGVEQFGGTIALVKAIDPIVLLATGSYAVSVARWVPTGWFRAGNEFGGSAGAVLAVSPETSLSFAFEAGHARPYQLYGQRVYRSDRTSAVFRVGVATLASRSGFLQVNVGMGLTSDVPQFELAVATPFQF